MDNGNIATGIQSLPAATSLKLNIGGATGPAIPGFTIIDRKCGTEAFPLGYADGTVDEIRASHVVEHLSRADAIKAIADWVRCLKVGGVIKIAVPDLDKILSQCAAGNPDNWPIQGYIYGGQTDPDDYHKCGYNGEWLTHLLESAGLVDVKPWISEVADCASLPVSLNLQGTKSAPTIKAAAQVRPVIPKTVALMSLPRLAWTCNMFSALEVAVARQLQFDKLEGCFWSQCLSRVIQTHIDGGAEWLWLTDYDSVYNVSQFDALCRLMLEHPEADAIAPLQCKRDDDFLLMGFVDADGNPLKSGSKVTIDHFKPDVIRASWAHFGGTLIRTSAIRRMAKPWFVEVPNADGEWGEGRTDADMYFWKNFAASGNRLFIAPHVVLLHAQVMYTAPNRELKPQHVYPKEYNEKGMPDWAWR